MLDPKMEKQLNQQINEELFSSYLYLAMSAYFSAEGLKGFAHWLLAQSQEEQVHAMKIYDYINDHGGRLALSPQCGFSSSIVGNRITVEDEKHKLRLIVETATAMWG